MANVRWTVNLDIQEYVFDDGAHGIKISGNDSVFIGYDALDIYKLLEECLNGHSDLYDEAQAFIEWNR